MSPGADLICLFHQAGEGLVELLDAHDPKLVHEQLLRIGRNPQEPFVLHRSLQVEESIERGITWFYAGKTTMGAFEADGLPDSIDSQ
jgi:hypothetical protein